MTQKRMAQQTGAKDRPQILITNSHCIAASCMHATDAPWPAGCRTATQQAADVTIVPLHAGQVTEGLLGAVLTDCIDKLPDSFLKHRHHQTCAGSALHGCGAADCGKRRRVGQWVNTTVARGRPPAIVIAKSALCTMDQRALHWSPQAGALAGCWRCQHLRRCTDRRAAGDRGVQRRRAGAMRGGRHSQNQA